MKTILYIGLGITLSISLCIIAGVISLNQTYIFLDNNR